ALSHLSFPEIIGAFLATGLLMLALGLTGWVRRIMDLMPMPIVMAMVAGVFLQFGLNLVYALRDGFWIAAPMAVTFLILSATPALARFMPPLIGALIVGTAAVMFSGGIPQDTMASVTMALPNFYVPVFSLEAMIELVVPLAITVLVVQNGQGFAVLTAAGHKPPVTPITVACGVFSIITAFVGTVSTCLTGPVNALISASGEPRRHYLAGVVVGILALVFGLMSPLFTSVMLATPAAFIAGLAGLAMLRVLQTAMITAFRTSFTLGALVTFLVTVADVPIFGLGAPFWGLVFGTAISWLLEKDDFYKLRESRAA
ncbi:MAG: benzoate/H(+) symporter BenE family transporter, partial [Fimbriimonadaceae bacterium]|nr:benzoate/H(+) symporter BenE family transporter [Alphaproteobacteria bacterium]